MIKTASMMIAVLLLCSFFADLPVAASEDNVETHAFIWIADVSGSMEDVDNHKFLSDTVSLGVDLAPSNSKSAFLAVSDRVVLQTPFLDISKEENRNTIKSTAGRVEYKGNTKFTEGIESALILLNNTEFTNKTIFFIGDISEGGFNLTRDDYSRELLRLSELTKQAVVNNVTVRMLFMGQVPTDNNYITYWNELASETGGNITFVSNPADMPSIIEDYYFSNYDYLKSVTTGVNTTNYVQSLTVDIPKLPIGNARLYIPSVAGVQATGSNSQLRVIQNRSYTMVDLLPPFSEKVELSFPPSDNIRVFLLVDSSLQVTADVESVAVLRKTEEAENFYEQKSLVTIAAESNGTNLFEGAVPDGLSYRLTMTDPLGERTDVEPTIAKDGRFIYEFIPQNFGEYLFELSVSSYGIELNANIGVDVPSIELPAVEIPLPRDYSLWIAVVAGGLVLVIATVIAVTMRRKHRMAGIPLTRMEHSDEVRIEDISDNSFAGKLDLYGIMVDGGKTEIPAATFLLKQISGKRWIRLSTVMESSGVPYHYKAADEIRLLPGGNSELIIKNHSDAEIFCAGQTYRKGQQLKLTFGQKVYIVFEQDVSEYEMYYHSSSGSSESVKSASSLKIAL
jgi:hypothetical protein